MLRLWCGLMWVGVVWHHVVQVDIEFNTLFDVATLGGDGTVNTVKKSLQDFIALFLSTGMHEECCVCRRVAGVGVTLLYAWGRGRDTAHPRHVWRGLSDHCALPTPAHRYSLVYLLDSW